MKDSVDRRASNEDEFLDHVRARTSYQTTYNADVADDPMDAFDKVADDIQRQQDELDAADKLRSTKATEKRKRKPDEATDAPPESTQRPKAD